MPPTPPATSRARRSETRRGGAPMAPRDSREPKAPARHGTGGDPELESRLLWRPAEPPPSNGGRSMSSAGPASRDTIALSARRSAPSGARARPRAPARGAHDPRDHAHHDGRDASGRRDRRVPLLGGLCDGGDFRSGHRGPGVPARPFRDRTRARDGELRRLHRGVHRGDIGGRSGAARDPRLHRGFRPARGFGASFPPAANHFSDRRGNGGHADSGHRDARRLRPARQGAGPQPRVRGSPERPRHRARHRRHRAQLQGRAPPLGTAHRGRCRLVGGGVLRPLRLRARRPGALDRISGAPLAGIRPRLRTGVLGPPPRVRARGPHRHAPDHEQLRGRPGRVLAPAPGGGLPGRPGRGGHGRGKPACSPDGRGRSRAPPTR